jgi:hypothetical protein
MTDQSGAAMTLLAVLVALLATLRVFDAFRAPRLRITFEHRDPWCRRTHLAGGSDAFWVRVGVENTGRGPARGCVGRLNRLTTDGVPRRDVDPIQLRWAGMPRSRAFDPVDIRRDQHEFLNVLVLLDRQRWRIVTFEDPDFDPGFSTELRPDHAQGLTVSVYADNAGPTTRDLVAVVCGPEAITLYLRS